MTNLQEKIEKEWKKDWKEFWKPLLLTKGKFDEKKIKNEMHDLVFIYKQVSEVYMYITGGMLSKPMYYADSIKTAYDDAIQEAVQDEVREAISTDREILKERINKIETFSRLPDYVTGFTDAKAQILKLLEEE